MKSNKKLLKKIGIISLILVLAAVVAGINVKVVEKLSAADEGTVFCNLSIFNKQYIIKQQRCNIFSLRILEKGNELQLEKLVSQGSRYVICLKGNNLDVYSFRGDFVSSYSTGSEYILSMSTGDIDLDGNDETLMITGKSGDIYGDAFSVYGFNKQFSLIYSKSIEDLKPWKVQICDVDGDKKPDISIGVYKTTLFHPVMAKRPFIYNWENGFISPKWLGSRLSQPFDDYIFCDFDMDGMDEIAAIENTEDNKKTISLYKWKGFGVEKIASGGKFENMQSIITIEGKFGKTAAVKVLNNNIWRWYKITYNNEKVFLNKGNGIINTNVY